MKITVSMPTSRVVKFKGYHLYSDYATIALAVSK